MKEEEKLLVEQAREGSEKAFSKLYQKYNKTIWFTIYNIVKNSDVADDLTSVVFTKVYEKLQTYVNHISFEMWLKTIAVNTSIDYIRRTKKEQLNNYIDDDEYTGQLDSDTKSPEEQMILSQNVEVIMKCIPLLRKKYRDLIYARLDGKSYHQISEELAIPEATVKTCLNKARAKLRQLFEDYK
jgi:RNA polymerase sigma-70 factor (ECF subfamily)